MKGYLSGLCALALVVGLAAGCSESPRDRLGESPSEREPAASPPTAPYEPVPGQPGGQPSEQPQEPSPPGTEPGEGESGTR
jgi:hypothetical protein